MYTTYAPAWERVGDTDGPYRGAIVRTTEEEPMSGYGSPQDPSAQPHPYGSAPGGQPTLGAPSGLYASWIQRVGASVIDGLPVSLGYIPAVIGSAIAGRSDGGTSLVGLFLGLVGLALAVAIFVWNTCLQGGRTGYSLGKSVFGIKLIGEQTGRPIGAGMAFVRQLAHILDSLPCYLGYLWPLWDAKRQTFADKVLGTVVINQPKP